MPDMSAQGSGICKERFRHYSTTERIVRAPLLGDARRCLVYFLSALASVGGGGGLMAAVSMRIFHWPPSLT